MTKQNPIEIVRETISAYTDINHHTKSVLTLAKFLEDKNAVNELKQIEKEIDLIGGLTYELDVKRRQIRLSLMEQLRIKHGQEVHDKLNSAF